MHPPQYRDPERPPAFPTAPPRLEDHGNMKRTRGKTLDFVALHREAPSKKTKP